MILFKMLLHLILRGKFSGTEHATMCFGLAMYVTHVAFQLMGLLESLLTYMALDVEYPFMWQLVAPQSYHTIKHPLTIWALPHRFMSVLSSYVFIQAASHFKRFFALVTLKEPTGVYLTVSLQTALCLEALATCFTHKLQNRQVTTGNEPGSIGQTLLARILNHTSHNPNKMCSPRLCWILLTHAVQSRRESLNASGGQWLWYIYDWNKWLHNTCYCSVVT